ncbi:uncharacterized protein LOC143818100 isoform X2 [Ranitomeya variabilis]|uniref:uncharacterized protein LOC143818100 isoform X2 n=1 Tax=Ranitomeya variabilis TaxID=490064 RepID=UPI0040565F1E
MFITVTYKQLPSGTPLRVAVSSGVVLLLASELVVRKIRMKVESEEEKYSDEKWLRRVKKAKHVFRPHKFREVSRFPFLERIDEEDEEEGDDLFLIDIRTDNSNKYIRLRSGCDVMIAWASEGSPPPMRLRKTAWASVESVNVEDWSEDQEEEKNVERDNCSVSSDEEEEVIGDDKVQGIREEAHSAENIRLHNRKSWIPKCFRKMSRSKVKPSAEDSEEKVRRPSKNLWTKLWNVTHVSSSLTACPPFTTQI